jgi:hypothetical protein
MPTDPKNKADYNYECTGLCYTGDDNTPPDFTLSVKLSKDINYIVTSNNETETSKDPSEIGQEELIVFEESEPKENTKPEKEIVYEESYSYYANVYVKNWWLADEHHQWSYLILKNNSSKEADVKIHIIDNEGNTKGSISKKINANGTLNLKESGEWYNINGDNTNTTVGWIKIESNQKLTGTNHVVAIDEADTNPFLDSFDGDIVEDSSEITSATKTSYGNIEAHYEVETKNDDGTYNNKLTDINIINPNNETIDLDITNIDLDTSFSISIAPQSQFLSWNNSDWRNLIARQELNIINITSQNDKKFIVSVRDMYALDNEIDSVCVDSCVMKNFDDY